MTYIVERLAELRIHLDHLEQLRDRADSATALRADLSLHNDVLFSLLTVCQLVIDISGELAARRGLRFEDCTSAVRSLEQIPGFDPALVQELVPLPGFRNVLIHEYIELDLEFAVKAFDTRPAVQRFVDHVSRMEETES